VGAWCTITAGEVRPTALAFHRAQPECGMVVHIERGVLPGVPVRALQGLASIRDR
jgi:hypothetical protein